MLVGVGHLVFVPVRTHVVEPVEKVDLGAGSAHVRVRADEFEQSSGSAFFRADYDRLRELFGAAAAALLG